jgi:hypothetical protein
MLISRELAKSCEFAEVDSSDSDSNAGMLTELLATFYQHTHHKKFNIT